MSHWSTGPGGAWGGGEGAAMSHWSTGPGGARGGGGGGDMCECGGGDKNTNWLPNCQSAS